MRSVKVTRGTVWKECLGKGVLEVLAREGPLAAVGCSITKRVRSRERGGEERVEGLHAFKKPRPRVPRTLFFERAAQFYGY